MTRSRDQWVSYATQPLGATLAVSAGEESPLGVLYRDHADRVACWVARLGGPACDVDDLVQEVFLRVHRLLPGFRGDADVATWLYRITANVVRSRRRRDRVRSFLLRAFGAQEDTLRRPPATPVDQMEDREAAALVYTVLDDLREADRTVMILADLEGCSAQEIARLHGIKPGAVWVRLHRARRRFAERLAEIENASDVSGRPGGTLLWGEKKP
jgi:RNA polymerase sigma-70 factor (ECF subfamily)